MREDLLGYLLSALEPHEMRRVEQALCDDPLLQMELEDLQRQLAPLDEAISSEAVFETPPDLVARTLAALPPRPIVSPSALDDVPARAACLLTPARVTPSEETRPSTRSAWLDFSVASLASLAVFALLIPSVARGRYEARKAQCQDHLRELGTAVTQYVTRNRRELLPEIAKEGPEAFAGMYAVRLNDEGLMDDASLRLCPDTGRQMLSSPSLFSLVSDDQERGHGSIQSIHLRKAHEAGDVDRLRWLQQTAGGDFAYNLGVIEDGHYAAPHYEGRATFAILGDTPVEGIEVGDEVDVTRLRWGHGTGANLLFEDGSVRFVDMSRACQLPDHPYLNHRGSMEAGVNIDDASLAPSGRPPFLTVRQR